jgi:translation initiation factor eIF-2B subunit epsilon
MNFYATRVLLTPLRSSRPLLQIFLFAARFPAALRTYLQSSRWAAHIDAKGVGSGATASTAADSSSSRSVAARPRIAVLTSPTAASAGEALRVIDGMQVLRGDTFILCDGMVVTNAALGTAIASHNARAKVDSNVTLTAVCVPHSDVAPASASTSASMTAHPSNVSKGPAESNLINWDPVEGRIWSFAVGSPAQPAQVPAPASVKGAPSDVRARIETRSDLAVSGVYVCSPNVIVHFSDNYDYTDIRRHYIHHEVKNVDMGWRFSAHVCSSAYACRVTDPRTLMAATEAVVHRLAAPFVPDSDWAASTRTAPRAWRSPRPGVYVQDGSIVEMQASLGPGTVVCAGAVVEAGATVRGTVVGKGARIGTGATVIDSVLMSNAVVGSKASVTASIIAEKALVGAGCTLGRGCVVGADVRIGGPDNATPPVQLQPFTRVTCTPYDDGFSSKKPARLSAAASAGSDAGVVGASGCGRQWPVRDELTAFAEAAAAADGADASDDEDDDDEAVRNLPVAPEAVAKLVERVSSAVREYARAARSGDAARLRSAHGDLGAAARTALSLPQLCGGAGFPELELAAPLVASAPAVEQKSAGGGGGAASQSGGASSSVAGSAFARGVAELVLPTGPRPSSFNNIALEVKSFKYAENKTFADCVRVLVPIVLDYIPRPSKGGPGGAALPLGAVLKGAQETLDHWSPLIAKFVVSADDEYAVVAATEAYVTDARNREDWFSLFGVLLKMWFDNDATTDTAVSTWAEEAEEAAAAPAEGLTQAQKDKVALWRSKWTQQLIESLDEEEEEDDEDEDEEEEEEEDDEEGDE